VPSSPSTQMMEPTKLLSYQKERNGGSELALRSLRSIRPNCLTNLLSSSRLLNPLTSFGRIDTSKVSIFTQGFLELS
jgi:hypothetical protein